MQSPLLPATSATSGEPERPLGLRPDGSASADAANAHGAGDDDNGGGGAYGDDTWLETLRRNFRPTSGDVNAFFAIILDNLANLTSLSGVLIFGFGMPAGFVYKTMIPGTTFGMMVGCWYLAVLALRLDRYYRHVNRNVLVTAIPLGLDAPSTVTLPLLVIGPAYKELLNSGKSVDEACETAWHYGCATVFMIGIVKLLLASVGRHVQAAFHATGKQGALAGIGFALLGLLNLTNIVVEPVAGLISLGFMLWVLIPRKDKTCVDWNHVLQMKLPFEISGVLVSAVLGAAIFYITGAAGISVTGLPKDVLADYTVTFYSFPNFWPAMPQALSRYVAIAIPYAILVHIGGMTVTDAAQKDGNDYSTNSVLVADALCTMLGAFFGGVTQTTPYIGHTVYHNEFKAGSAYTIWSGTFVGLGGLLGYISLFSEILPPPVILPIFIFVAFEIVSETFNPQRKDLNEVTAIQPQHAPAIVFAMFPIVAQLVNIILGQLYAGDLNYSVTDPDGVLARHPELSPAIIRTCGVFIQLAHGFINTGLLWGSTAGHVIDNNLRAASLTLCGAALLAFFGIIHSVRFDGGVYWPGTGAMGSNVPYQWFAGYLALAAVTWAMSYLKPTLIAHEPGNTPRLPHKAPYGSLGSPRIGGGSIDMKPKASAEV